MKYYKIHIPVFLVILVISQAINYAYAQSGPFGIKGGFNISTIGGDSEGVGFKPGYQMGIISHFEITDDIIIQPELIFSNQGTRSKSEPIIRYHYNYVHLPVSVKYKSDDIFLSLGIQMGVLVNTKVVNTVTKSKESVIGQLNNYDMALIAGFSRFMTERLEVEGRYSYGISNTSVNPDYEGLKFYNRVLQVSFSYYLTGESK